MPLLVATHSGPFHADDVMAVALIRTFLDAEAHISRSRDPEKWAAADIVVDVGGIYDPAEGRFDRDGVSYVFKKHSKSDE